VVNDADQAGRTCAPYCDYSLRDSLSNRLVVSNVFFGLGAAALAAAGIVWLVTPRSPTSKTSALGSGTLAW
jgi:hypothetical protein